MHLAATPQLNRQAPRSTHVRIGSNRDRGRANNNNNKSGHVRYAPWSCKNVLEEIGCESQKRGAQAAIAAINGLIPMMFMTRVRL
jgi:hypothetical protein